MSLALPMTAAQLINVLYSVVDRMYLGRLPGHLALTGLGLTIPIISIIMGFANLCGTGGAPLCSIHRGRGDNEEAECVLGNAFTLLLIFGTAVTVFFLALRRPVLYLFGASDATYPYASAYMTIYLAGYPLCHDRSGDESFYQLPGLWPGRDDDGRSGSSSQHRTGPDLYLWVESGCKGSCLGNRDCPRDAPQYGCCGFSPAQRPF
ncbi:MAG: MATE family efflux transporter [Oscillospiraceae bacterium]